MSKKFTDIDWYNIWQCLDFLERYPEIGWHGKAREQISPSWPRAFEDLEFLEKNMTELMSYVREAKANSKFYGKNRGLTQS